MKIVSNNILEVEDYDYDVKGTITCSTNDFIAKNILLKKIKDSKFTSTGTAEVLRALGHKLELTTPLINLIDNDSNIMTISNTTVDHTFKDGEEVLIE